MPWTIEDVDRHKKGLSDKNKKLWVTVANNALKTCLEKGGNQKTCEVSAIRQANSVTNNNSYLTQNILINNYITKTQIYDGKECFVVPVTMMVEGVHNGSKGPLLHLAEELGDKSLIWNGIPVTIGHPLENNNYVSANSPNIHEKAVVGRIFNSFMDDKKLKAEAWIEKEKINQIYPDGINKLNQGVPIEVSLGVFTDDELISGKWNNETYIAIAHNYKPDHLALLFEEKGACSWKDGCGIRINIQNQKGGNDMPEDKKKADCPLLKKANMIIQNEGSAFTKDDETWLVKLEEANLDKILALQNQKIKEKIVKDPIVFNKQEAIQVLKDELKTPEQFINLLPNEMRDQMKIGLKLHNNMRNDLIKQISAYELNVYSEDELKLKSTDELQKLSAFIPKQVDYSPMSVSINNQNTEILTPTGIELNS